MHFSYTGRATYPRFAFLSYLFILLYTHGAACQDGLETIRVEATNMSAIFYQPALDSEGWGVIVFNDPDLQMVMANHPNVSMAFQFMGKSGFYNVVN